MGGIGLHDLSRRNKAFSRKLVWQMYKIVYKKWFEIIKDNTSSPNPNCIFTIQDPPKGLTI